MAKKKSDPRIYFGIIMGTGSLIAGLVRAHVFEGGFDLVFWSMAAVFVAGVAMTAWYIGRRRLHSQTRTFIDRPARKPSPRHDGPED
ncbi:MAG: hypothetical protein KF699_12350 [Phycisphaeraceae bacterium]|nr:hypothetical protein [Phycisphaeraceae bacterium]